MIIVNSPLMQKQIQQILEEMEEPNYTFVKKDGIKLYFETNMEDKEEAATIAKKAIKSSDFGSALMFKVKTGEYI